MSVRILAYSALLYQNLIKKRLEEIEEAKKKGKIIKLNTTLPRILPIVLYNGESSWTAPLDVKDMVQKGPVELDKYLPSMSYFLFNLHGIEQEVLETKKGFSTFMFQMDKEYKNLKILLKLFRMFINHPDIPQGEEFKKIVRHWLKTLIKAGPEFEGKEEYLKNLDDLLTYEEVYNMLSNTISTHWATEWIAQGREEGLEKGLEEGLKKGEVKGMRRIVFHMLKKELSIAEIAEQTGLSQQEI